MFISFRLGELHDQDLIDYLSSIEPKLRSRVIRQLMRDGLKARTDQVSVDVRQNVRHSSMNVRQNVSQDDDGLVYTDLDV